MDFINIIGYQTIKQRLCQLVTNDTIPHASLISGPHGSPVLSIACALATYIHCTRKTPSGSCGTCSSCVKSTKLLHPDLYFLFPVGSAAKSKAAGSASAATTTLPTWRSFLANTPSPDLQEWAGALGQHSKQMKITTQQVAEAQHFLRTYPIESTHKIVLIWLPEHIYPPAAHKLLKTLEEPPKNTLFILASHDTSRILPTVSSRTWSIAIPPFQDQDIEQALSGRYPELPAERIKKVTQMAAGDLNVACSLAEATEDTHFQPFAQWLRSVYAKNWPQLIESAEAFEKSTPTAQKAWILYALQLARTTLMSVHDPGNMTHTSEEALAFCKKLSDTITFPQLEELVEGLESMYTKLLRNAHAKLLFITTSLHISTYFSR